MFNNAASRDENTRIISAHIHDHQQYTAALYNALHAAGGWWPALPGLGWMTTAYTGAPCSKSLGRYLDTVCLFFANSSTILSPLTIQNLQF